MNPLIPALQTPQGSQSAVSLSLKTDSTIDQVQPTTGFQTIFIGNIPSGVTLQYADNLFRQALITAVAGDIIFVSGMDNIRFVTTGTSAGGTIAITMTPFIIWRTLPPTVSVSVPTPLDIKINQTSPNSTVDKLRASTIATGQVSVLVTATSIIASSSSRKSITILNTDSTNPIYLGVDSTVTSSTGHKLPAGGSITLDNSNSAIYGIATGGTVVVTYLTE